MIFNKIISLPNLYELSYKENNKQIQKFEEKAIANAILTLYILTKKSGSEGISGIAIKIVFKILD